MSLYEPVIGLEIHAQISSKTKMFCSCDNDSFLSEPNTNVCPICMGFPGMLPVANEECITKGIAAGLALNCEIQERSKFDRKNYFYPDLPKGYQISQYDQPIAVGGSVEIDVEGKNRAVRLNRLHLEDDAGKLTHVAGGTLCDYNRSGSPLMEIVSEPDLFSIEEASAYAQEIRRILRYVGSSECDMEKGMMRFDLNISLRKKGEEKLGTKVEIKNINSFRALERAAAYEFKRQEEMLEKNEIIKQETRGWDDDSGKTVSQRSKEEAHDYRYFPEPDLPPVEVNQEEIQAIKVKLPELPLIRRRRFIEEYGLTPEDATLFTETADMSEYFEKTTRESSDPKKSAAFISSILLKYLNRDQRSLADCKVSAEQLGKLIGLINKGVISNNMGKTEVFEAMYQTGDDPEKIVQEKGLGVVSDTSEIESACKEVIEQNAGPAADYKGGKEAALGFLVGKVMQVTKGKANPVMVNDMLKKILG